MGGCCGSKGVPQSPSGLDGTDDGQGDCPVRCKKIEGHKRGGRTNASLVVYGVQFLLGGGRTQAIPILQKVAWNAAINVRY